MSSVKKGTKYCLLTSLLLVSLAWLPALQRLQLPHRRCTTQCSHAEGPAGVGDATTLLEDTHWMPSTYRARYKADLITNAYKLLFTPSVAMLIVFIKFRHHLSGAFPVDSLGRLTLANFSSNETAATLDWFVLNVTSSFLGYVLGLLGCMAGMQKAAFALPLILATPTAFLACIMISSRCPDGLRWIIAGTCQSSAPYDTDDLRWLIPALFCLWAAQILSTFVDVFRSQPIVMEKEENLFWHAGYSSVFLEQYMLLGRRTHRNDGWRQKQELSRKRVRVFICTTMYREKVHEMEQLLLSLAAVNRAQMSLQNCEAHIFFDNGIKGKKVTEFVLQLLSLLKGSLGVDIKNCTKVLTPYGMCLSWRLPGLNEHSHGMGFSIHLKDSFKVKNKKRWSQIMYMSFVLDHIIPETGASETESFIVTTDADVKFNSESVEVLLDLLMRSTNVGAACCRTLALGSGPLVWYQQFDYSVAHWFQKAAEHMIGTVLCCPGCFSVYRAKAVKDVLPLYASKVNQASEFLIKDMGEDRWLSTLMVQAGWRLEYSAAAVVSTHCPEDFGELYRQRRRWIPSTLANQVLLLRQWGRARARNYNVGICFLIYEGLLLLSTVISPAVTIFVITGGLQLGYGIPLMVTLVVMLVITAAYGLVCLKCQSETQILVAKWLTFFFTIVMAMTVIGIATQVVQEFASTCDPKASMLGQAREEGELGVASTVTGCSNCSMPSVVSAVAGEQHKCSYTPVIPGTTVNVSTVVVLGFIGIFLVTGLLHPSDIGYLMHGIWYFLCLPSGYILLIVYSLCNITDESWGTREARVKIIAGGNEESFADRFKTFYGSIFSCCRPIRPEAQAAAAPVAVAEQPVTCTTSTGRSSADGRTTGCQQQQPTVQHPDLPARGQPVAGIGYYGGVLSERIDEDAALEQSDHHCDGRELGGLQMQQLHAHTREWLRDVDPHFEELYAHKFIGEGYTDTSFIGGITDVELKALHIDNVYHRRILLDASKHLDEPDIDVIVPLNPLQWLSKLGLGEYSNQFKLNLIHGADGLERLKTMTQREIEQILKIRKRGHIRRLIQGIKCLRYPTGREKKIRDARADLNDARLSDLRIVSPVEVEFWEDLRQECLLPEPAVFGHDGELKEQLAELRSTTLMAFVVVNTLWLFLMVLLDYKPPLTIQGANPLGLSSLFLFTLLLVAQFCCMIAHRFTTALHAVARAPFLRSNTWKNDFYFNEAARDDSAPDAERIRVNHHIRSNEHNDSRLPLLDHESPAVV